MEIGIKNLKVEPDSLQSTVIGELSAELEMSPAVLRQLPDVLRLLLPDWDMFFKKPVPSIINKSSFISIFAPNDLMPSIVAIISSEKSILLILLTPLLSEAHIIARCAILLEGGILTLPLILPGFILIQFNKNHTLFLKINFLFL